MNNSAIIITAVTVVSLLLLAAGVVMSFRSSRTAVVATFAGMLGIGLLTVGAKATELIFWGIATAIVVAIQYLLPANVTASRRGVGYIVGATLAGMSVGLTLGREWVTVGAAFGAILGGIYSYSWSNAKETLSICTNAGIYELSQMEELTYTSKQCSICGIPIEKVIKRNPTTKYLFHRNNFSSIIANNQIYTQGFYDEIKSFVDCVENQRISANRFESLKEIYYIVDKIKNY